MKFDFLPLFSVVSLAPNAAVPLELGMEDQGISFTVVKPSYPKSSPKPQESKLSLFPKSIRSIFSGFASCKEYFSNRKIAVGTHT
jgi:hypothetical protein